MSDVRRVMFVGEKPGASMGPQEAFSSGKSAERLADLMGCSLEQFREKYFRQNIFGDHSIVWDLKSSRLRARLMVGSVTEPTVMVLCGGLVARAFGMEFRNSLQEYQVGLITFVKVPHPSGLNRWWNDQVNVERARSFLSRYRR